MHNKDFKPKLIHPLETYQGRVPTIHDIPLTHREIDVITCLLSGRKTKEIANILSVAPKTVATHIYNVAKRFGCSPNRIITLIESSDQFFSLKQHYVTLLVNKLFKKTLKEINKHVINNNAPLRSILIYWQKKPLYLETLKHNLIDAGLSVSLECRKGEQAFDHLRKVSYHNECLIYFLSERWLEIQQIQLLAQEKDAPSRAKIFFLPKTAEAGAISPELFPYPIINPSDWHSYYFSAFSILKNILPAYDLEDLFVTFEKQAYTLHRSLPTHTSTPNLLQEGSERTDDKFQSRRVLIGKNLRYIYPLLGILSLGLVIFWSLNQVHTHIYSSKRAQLSPYLYSSSVENSSAQPIRSDLFIPSTATLLNRPDLIRQIEDQFDKQREEAIQTVALLGIGGSGKTILARQYAYSQNLSVVWEINAETRENLRQSFENFARALSKTESDQKEFKRRLDITNLEEREERLIAFVKEKLLSLSPWLLIYDNMDKLTDIQKYFPHDSQTWGQGKVIITTRDTNIQNNKYINSFIQIREISPYQKLTLFFKIMKKQDTSLLSPLQIKEAKTFLEKLPPFPLDISIAAYYLKATNAPYQTYLKNLEENHRDFAGIQKNLLEDMGYYTRNRYEIIRVSLDNLMKSHKDFEELLLLISLLDAQNIPRKLLEVSKSGLVVDKFIFHLKKYSLIINEPSNSTLINSNLSIHRSTQEVSLDYLKKSLNLEQNSPLMGLITITLEKYMESIQEALDYPAMKSFVSHCEFLLSHKNMFNDVMRASINGELGIIYSHLHQYEKAKGLLEKSLNTYKKHSLENYKSMARILTYLGSVHRKLRNYEQSKVLIEQSLGIYKRYLPKNYRDIARSLTYLGITFRNQGDYKKAKDLLEQSLEIYKKYLPHNPAGTWKILVYLGTVYRSLGLYEKSKNILEASLILHQEEFPENLVDRAHILTRLGNVYRKLENYRKARDLLEQSLVIYKKTLFKNHKSIGWVFAYLGNVYNKLGEHEKAKDLLEKSFIILRENYSDNYGDDVWIPTLLEKFHNKVNKYEAIKDLLNKNS